MKRYEYESYKPSKLFNKKKNYFFKKYGKSIKRVDLTSFYSPNLNYKYFVIRWPSNWDAIMISKVIKLEKHKNLISKTNNVSKFIYFYSSTYFFYLPLPILNHLLTIDVNTSSVLITTPYTTNYSRLYWFYLRNAFHIFHKPFFNRVKFKGKGYYIFKNKRNTVTPQFGHSHRIYFYSYFASVLFLAKTRILVFGFSKSDVISVSHGIKTMRPINIFTGRGVRFNRQVVFRKTGKVSSYR